MAELVSTMADKPKRKGGQRKDYKPHAAVRIPAEIYRGVREIAIAADRPVTWQIRRILQDAIDAHKLKNPPPASPSP